MRLSVKILVLLMLPFSVFAQSTVTLKKQANYVAQALIKGDYVTIVEYMYPKVVQNAGGKQKMLQMLTNGINQMKAQGITFKSAVIGEPGKFYKAGTEIHCLVPQTIRMATASSSIANNGNLLAISQDGGKNWTFLDLNANTINSIPKLFPNFNKDLKLPQPKSPGL